MNKLFVGLDIGTESIGYAVTSEDYSLCKINGKDMWGVRLFNEADTAIERRAFRTSRRRIERRKLRVELLQELFAKEISTKDPGFFMRLSDSFYIAEDKTDKQPYSLFSGKEYNDVFYHAEYPTIYHLRKALINGENLDIRLLYLAIHHIIKYRGHFLFGNQDFSAVLKIDGLILSLNNLIAGEQSSGFDTSRLQALECAILENKMTVTAKKKKFAEILLPTTSCEKEMIAIISGGKVGTAKLFGNELYADSEVKSIQFSDASFEEIALPKLEGFLSDEEFEILQILKGIYDWTVLFGILDGETQISFAMCKRYEKHGYDLKTLKALIKDKYPSKYNTVFRKDKLYSAYIGTVKTKNKKEIVKKVTDKEVFYKELRKILETKDENILSDERYQYIKAEMETRSFLPKQVSPENSVLPYQLNKNELSIILKNAENHFEFLKSSDGKYTISEKIKMLLEFRIPYYVGPLNNHHEEKGFAWVVRKKEGRVTPWNFEEKVDIEASGEKFITKMTNKCSYLTCENVIAKDSMLYQKFMVLNEINNLKVNGQAITVEIKQRIFNELFLRLGKVSKKTLRTFMY